MKEATKDAFTTWAAASAIWVALTLALYELLNLLLGHSIGLGVQNRALFVILGAVAAGLIAVVAGYLARQRLISRDTRERRRD